VGLGFNADLVDEDAGVCCESGKGKNGAVVNGDNLADCAGVL
jgi:hypothetical protein